MKLSIFYYQESTSYNVRTEVNLNESDLNKLIGSSVQKLYRIGQLSKTTGSRVFNFSEPINVLVEVDGKQLIDTADTEQIFQQKLKFQRTREGAQRFGARVYAIARELLRGFEVVTLENVASKQFAKN